MIQLKLKIEGMACGMCESHVNDAIRRAFSVKKVTSSHSKGETVILCEEAIDHTALAEEIEKSGYRVLSVSETPYEKKGLFSRFGK